MYSKDSPLSRRISRTSCWRTSEIPTSTLPSRFVCKRLILRTKSKFSSLVLWEMCFAAVLLPFLSCVVVRLSCHSQIGSYAQDFLILVLFFKGSFCTSGVVKVNLVPVPVKLQNSAGSLSFSSCPFSFSDNLSAQVGGQVLRRNQICFQN